MLRLLITFLYVLVTAAIVFAGGTLEDSGHAIHVDGDGFAAKGADVVAYFSLEPGEHSVAGNDRYTFAWRNATYLFSTVENRDLFASDPERYVPAYGGYCAWAMASDKLASIDPDRWTIVDGTLYLNYNKRIQNDWLKHRDEMIMKADEYWPDQATALTIPQ